MARWLPSIHPTPFLAGGATCLVVLLVWSAVWPELHAQAREQEDAIAFIRQKGGRVQRDNRAPGQPIIGIDFHGSTVTNADLAILKQLQSFQHLNLTQTAITDAGLKHIESLSQLRYLYLPVSITDAGLVHIKGLTHLEHLSLLDSQVSDAGLVHLTGLHNLKLLLLNGTKVTDAGLRGIRQALPRTKIDR